MQCFMKPKDINKYKIFKTKALKSGKNKYSAMVFVF